MKILILSQYFWPESFIINDLVTTLVNQGHTIEVLTGKPNYPDGAIFEGYSAYGCTTEYFGGKILVKRIPIVPRGKGGAKRLLFNYLSFVISGLVYFYSAVKKQKFDIIFVFAPSPITSVIPAIYLKKRLKIPLAVWVQDLWPESLSATGFIKNRYILNFVGRIVQRIYAATDLLLVQSYAFKKPVSKYVNEDKIFYYPNSFLEDSADQSLIELLPKDLVSLLENNRCFVFAGNLGKAQSLETIVQAAEHLTHLSNCKILLVGSGSMSKWIEQQILAMKLDNLIRFDRFPSTFMSSLFARSTGLLVTLKKDDIFSYTIPSKIQSYLAAGRPIIAAIDGEGGRIILESGAGFSSSAEDGLALANNIERVYCMSELDRDKLGQSGRAYFLKHFEMVSQCRRLIELLENK